MDMTVYQLEEVEPVLLVAEQEALHHGCPLETKQSYISM